MMTCHASLFTVWLSIAALTPVPFATLLFFLVPLIEMIILINVGSMIGVLPTVLLVVLTAVCGVWLLRSQGLATFARVQEKMAQGEMPETELLEGIMLIFGGALLLTPGFATDALGFVCLLPGLRRPLASKIIRSATFRTFSPGAGGAQGASFHYQQRSQRRYHEGETINGEFSDESQDSGSANADKLNKKSDDSQPP